MLFCSCPCACPPPLPLRRPALRSLPRLTHLTVREESSAAVGAEAGGSHPGCLLNRVAVSILACSLPQLKQLDWNGLLVSPHPSTLSPLSTLTSLQSLSLGINQVWSREEHSTAQQHNSTHHIGPHLTTYCRSSFSHLTTYCRSSFSHLTTYCRSSFSHHTTIRHMQPHLTLQPPDPPPPRTSLSCLLSRPPSPPPRMTRWPAWACSACLHP